MDEESALNILEENFEIKGGNIIRAKKVGYKPTDKENELIVFLFENYDYGFIPSH